MDVVQGETIKTGDDVVAGDTLRAKEIAEVKKHAEELQKSVEGTTITADMINRGTTPKAKAEDDDDWQPSAKLKLYSIYCEPCGFKKLTDGSDVRGLVTYKQSLIPGGIPYRDPATGEIKTPLSRPNSKKFKCPKCGRVVTVRKVADSNTVTGRSYDE